MKKTFKQKIQIRLFSLIILLNFSIAPLFAQNAVALLPEKKEVTAETALASYINNNDNTFQWAIVDSFSYAHLTAYNIVFTSQVWHGITWTHQLTMVVPADADKSEALLFITGGRNEDGQPRLNTNKDDATLVALATIATSNKAVVALLRQTPNQPLFGSMTEDELISYTLHNFKKDKDYTWPLLFPMVKSATKAMDVIQEFVSDSKKKKVDKFVVSGASKRGWTTWLTGAIDKRVVAIAPMVIDILNMPVSLEYQIQTWGDYSIQIQDYVNLEIPQSSNTPEGQEISTMIDPYSYRQTLNMPKMLFMGTNDEYWVVDNVKNYIDDIPGTNILHYVPNAGHDLGGGKQAMNALGAFFANTINGKNYPNSQWDISKKGKGVKVKMKATPDLLEDVIVWSAVSGDKDFRDDQWTSRSLGVKSTANIEVNESLPQGNYKAFYIDLKYKNPNGGSYTQSSRVFVLDSKGMM
jgi:PhoPQ-activated pathogenicity-related protein